MGGSKSRPAGPTIVAQSVAQEAAAATKFEGHAVWVLRPAEVAPIVGAWGHSLELGEVKAFGLTEASRAGGRGMYLAAPAAPPQLVVLLRPGEVNVIERIAMCPQTSPAVATEILCDWVVSMVPKRCKITCAEDIASFSLDAARINRVAA
ncbi:unnamed protein product [Effrenium voratum]|nr:unnamed protein product [Effrenium voratum]